MPKLPDVSLLGERDPRPSYGVPNMPRNPIPAALEGMGNAIQGAAINLRNEQKSQQSEAERVERYAYTTKLLDFERQERDYLTKSSEGVAPGAVDFTKSSVTGYDQRAREFFKDVPAHLRPEMDTKLVQLRGSIEGGAQKFESEEGRRYHGNRIDDSLTVMLARQKQNPDAWTDIQKEGEDLIRNAPIFSNVEKDEKIRAWRERRVLAWVEENPGKARKAMATMATPQGGDLPVITANQPGRVSKGSTEGLNPDLLSKFKATQNAFGKSVPIVSGFRDAATNAKAKGASGSQHIHGNAIDVDVTGLSQDERIALIRTASANGITGIGVYENSIHLDTGSRRAWGPDRTSASVPRWAIGAINEHRSGVAKTSRIGGGAPAPRNFDELWPRLIRQESGGDQGAVSPKGATGIAQIMPGTGPEAAKLAGLPWDETRFRTDASYNEALGKAYLKDQFRKFNGDPAKALAAYNAGPGRTHAAIEKYGDDWLNHMPAETQNYVASIMGGNVPSGGSSSRNAPLPPEFEGVPYEKLQIILGKQERVNTQFMDDDIASIRATGVPLVPDPNSVIGSVPDDKAESYLMGRALAEQYHGAVTDMQQMPDDQLQARVEQMRPAPGSANFEALQKNYQDVQTAANAIREQRKKDPAGYVMATNPDVAEAWKNFDPKNPATAKAAIGETVFAQKSIGIPSDRIAPLPAQQAESVAAIINDTEQPVDARIQTLVGMIGITGDEDQQQAIFNQLSKAGVSDKTALVFDAYMRGDVGAARRLFEAATVKAENMPGKAQRAPGFEDAVSDAMFGAGTAGEVFYSLDLHDPATTAVAQRDYELVKTAATLAMAAGKDQDEAIDQAIKDVHGPVIRVNEMLGVDGNVRGVVPEGTDTDALIAGMAAALPAVKEALKLTRDASVSGFIANNGTAAKPVADATGQAKIDDVMAEGLFRNHGNGWAFFDPFSNAFVQDAGGNIMTWTTDDFMLMRLPDEIRPPPGGMSGNGAAVKDVPAVDLSGQPASAIDSYFPPAGAN